MGNKTTCMQQSRLVVIAAGINKQAYMKPNMEVIQIESEGDMMKFSGQHNPGHHHTTPIEAEDED